MSQERHIFNHLLDLRAGIMPPKELPEAPSMLRPDATTSGKDVVVGGASIWVPPASSIASRRPPARSKGCSRGFVVDCVSNREVVYESTLERDFAVILLSDRRIKKVHDQPPAVSYIAKDGRRCRHTFDFLATTAWDTTIAFAVKPSAKVAKSGIAEIVDLIRNQVGARFADRFQVMTEKQITKPRAANGRLILHSRRGRSQQDVEQVRTIAASIKGAVKISDLVVASGLEARGFNAAINLIDEGFLTVVDEGGVSPICYHSLVTPTTRSR
jgi:hypothetical protein